MNPGKDEARRNIARLRGPRKFHGVGLVVAVMRSLDPATRREILASMSAQAPELGRLIEKCDFLYPDLMRLDDASLLLVFNRFDEREWAIAWKLTEETLKKRFLTVLRAERRQDFLDFAASLPRMPKMQVVAVQIHLASRIREMLQKGVVRAMNPLTAEREKLTKLRVKSGAVRR